MQWVFSGDVCACVYACAQGNSSGMALQRLHSCPSTCVNSLVCCKSSAGAPCLCVLYCGACCVPEHSVLQCCMNKHFQAVMFRALRGS